MFTLISGLRVFWLKKCVCSSVFSFFTIPTWQKSTFVQRNSMFWVPPKLHRSTVRLFFFQIQWMYSDAGFYGDYDFPSNMTGVKDSMGIWPFKVKLLDHSFKIVSMFDFGRSYVRQSLDAGHVWWQNQNLRSIPHCNISAEFDNTTVLEGFRVILVKWLHDDYVT